MSYAERFCATGCGLEVRARYRTAFRIKTRTTCHCEVVPYATTKLSDSDASYCQAISRRTEAGCLSLQLFLLDDETENEAWSSLQKPRDLLLGLLCVSAGLASAPQRKGRARMLSWMGSNFSPARPKDIMICLPRQNCCRTALFFVSERERERVCVCIYNY